MVWSHLLHSSPWRYLSLVPGGEGEEGGLGMGLDISSLLHVPV